MHFRWDIAPFNQNAAADGIGCGPESTCECQLACCMSLGWNNVRLSSGLAQGNSLLLGDWEWFALTSDALSSSFLLRNISTDL
jgi:hypothetical protein